MADALKLDLRTTHLNDVVDSPSVVAPPRAPPLDRVPSYQSALFNPAVYKVQSPVDTWNRVRNGIVGASIGVRTDLSATFDKMEPGLPGMAFPLDHGQVHSVANVSAGRVVLRPENLVIGLVKENPKVTALVASYTDAQTNEVLGYVIRWFNVPERLSHRKYLMFQPDDLRTKGVGLHVASAWETFVPMLGIEHTTMEAAYVGRLVWALEGFDFDSQKTRDDVMLRFARFMMRFDLHPDDLYIRRDDGTQEPFSFDKLHYPWDFAHVMSKLGTIRLPTRTSDAKDDEGVLDAGRAFMLGDFRNADLANCVCPDFFGERPTDPTSACQLQAKAYARARAAKGR